MKKIWLSVLAALVAITVVPAGATEKAAPWIAKMTGAMDKAYTCKYAADMNVTQMGQSMKMVMSGDMAQADDKHYRGSFSIDVKAPGMPEGMNMSLLIVADGTNAWMETTNPMMGGKQVMKLKLEGLDELAATNPQFRGIQDMNPGYQLAKMTDSFDVDLAGIADGKVTLTADMDPAKMAEIMGPMAGSDTGAVKKLTVVIEEKTGVPVELRVGEPPMFVMNFSEFKFVDGKSLMDQFGYTPPEGAQVMDLNALIGAGAAAAPAGGN